MKTKLMPTQLEDIKQLVERPDLPNYSKPGTGKTLTTIGAMEAMGFKKGVIVAPPIALPMWRDVLAAELGVSTRIVPHGRFNFINNPADFYVMSYGMATAHAESIKRLRMDYAAIVLDESHALKTPGSQRTRALFGDASDGMDSIVEHFDYVFSLTGTPIERHSDDMWSQLRAIKPEALAEDGTSSLVAFRAKYCRQAMKSYHPRQKPKLVTVGSQNEEALHDLMYKQIGAIRRTLDDVTAYMPPVTFREIAVDLTPSPELGSLIKNRTVAKIVAGLVEGDPIMATARRLLGISKLKSILDYVVEQALDHPLLVGYIHTDFGKALTEALVTLGVRAEIIGGATSQAERERIVSDFNEGRVRVIVGQIAAMGVSLNLQQGARHVIVAEDDWSAAKIEQFYGRVWRLGQNHHVQVDFCTTKHPIDEAIVYLREAKAGSAELVHKKAQ